MIRAIADNGVRETGGHESMQDTFRQRRDKFIANPALYRVISE